MCCICIAVKCIFSPLLVFPRIDIIQLLDRFITNVEKRNGSLRPNKKKNTQADNHTRLVSSLFDYPSSSIY